MKSKQHQNIRFHYQSKVAISGRNNIKSIVARILNDAGLKAGAINYIFCSDKELWKLNKQYLNHDTYTDIITFDLSDSLKVIIADIYISIDRVRENANSTRQSLRNELMRVIFHGALHLTGIKDKSAKDKKVMRQQEDAYLQMFYKTFHEARFHRET